MKVLVADEWLPTPDRDTASLRMVHLLGLLRERGAQVTFAAEDFAARPSGLAGLVAAGIEVLMPPESPETHLRARGGVYDLIVLSRLTVAGKYAARVRELAPHARVVFDTTDLVFLRGFRGARVLGNQRLLARALEAKKIELDTVRRADATLVVSPVEQAMLQTEVPTARVVVLSNIHTLSDAVPPFAERAGIVFIGAFPHHPNTDGMQFFCREILPKLRHTLGGVKITVIGSEPPDWLVANQDENFLVTGYMRDTAPYLQACRLTIAPLRYGAGVKGKVTLSMSYGVPVVGTRIAAEGTYAQDGHDMLIADEPKEFARKVCALYQDEALWQTLSANGRVLVQEHFSVDAARRALNELLASWNL